MIKAIFIDIDGTLRDSNRKLSAKTVDTIKKVTEKGILVILCSGRPRKYTEEISRECFASKYIITSSGGNIYDYEQNKILYVNEMNKEALIKLYEIANPEDVRFIMNVGEGRVVNKVKHQDQEKKLEEDINNNIIGYGRIIGDKTIFLYIQDIMVIPEYQHKRVGTDIMKKILEKINEYFKKLTTSKLYLNR